MKNEEDKRMAEINEKELDEIIAKYEAMDVEVPEDQDAFFLQLAREIDRKRELEQKISKKQAMRRAATAAAIVLALLLFFGISDMQPVEAFRAKFLNTIKKDDVGALVMKSDAEELLKDWEDYWYPTYIPEGYSLWEAVADDFRKILIFSAENDTDKIRLSSFDADSTQATHDTDNHEYKEISIGAYKGYLFSNEENQFLRAIWIAEKDLLMLESSGSLSEEELLKFAESLKFIKK